MKVKGVFIASAMYLGIAGFASVTCMDTWGVFSGSAREAAKLFLVIHLLINVAFIIAGQGSMRANAR
jgi:hypothetical protein